MNLLRFQAPRWAFGGPARNLPTPHGVALDLAHDPLHAHQETPMERRGLVDTVALRNQTGILGTQIAQGRPIGAVPGQARALIAQPHTDLAQGARGQERLLAVASRGALGCAAHVSLHDLEACIGPAEMVRMLTHSGLELLALALGEHRVPGGLPHVEHGFATERMRVHQRSR